jgi:hypothetical protein
MWEASWPQPDPAVGVVPHFYFTLTPREGLCPGGVHGPTWQLS